jgi:serine/threonine protein kinase
MSWPLISDFSRMMQTPKVAFRKPELRECTIEKDALGQPKARSGNFATVFKGFYPDGRALAVRVFNRQGDDRRERYASVCRYLEDLPVSSLVRFEFDERGIRSASDGKLYPLLTMEWVPGVTLFEWARDRCREGYGQALAIGAEVWLALVRELSTNNVVHGDLQHANVMVSSEGHFKLVDYDCMSVPELEGRPNVELGMEPYQHPGRQMDTPMLPGLDNFSALVIYVALRALGAAPHLWINYVDNIGYDKLLFRKEDFADPSQSHLYYELMHSPDEQVRDLTHYLFELLKYKLEDIPPIDEVLLWCNSLDQLLAARDWDTAVALVQRISVQEQIADHLRPLVDEAQARVKARERLEAALAAGDEYLVQQRYTPDLLDDYPAAAPIVEQARQAPKVRQLLEVLKASLQFQRWDLFRRTWIENEGLLDKRASAKPFKPEFKKLLAADTLQKMVCDPNSEDLPILEIWDQIQAEGGHPLAAPLAQVVEGRRARQQAITQFREIVDNAPETPTLVDDRKIIEAWRKDLFDNWDRISSLRKQYRAAVKRIRMLQEAHKAINAERVTLDGERAIADAATNLPPDYYRKLNDRAPLAQTRVRACDKIRQAADDGSPDSVVLQAWKTLEESDACSLLPTKVRSVVQAVLKRAEAVEALKQINSSWAPQQIERKLLEVWDDEALQNCPAADPWRAQYKAARVRQDLIEEIGQAIEKSDETAVQRLTADPRLAHHPLPANVAEKLREMNEGMQQRRAARRQALVAALTSTRRKEFYELFDKQIIREICEQFQHHQPLVNQWIEDEILSLERCGLAAVEEHGLKRISDEHYRARWVWPDTRFADRCRLVVTPQLPKPNANLDNLSNHLAFTIDRNTWDAGAGYRDLLTEKEWIGCYVLVWAILDVGFQTFDTQPLQLGQLEAEEPQEEQQPKKKGWSLFRRGKEKEEKKQEEEKKEE